MESKQYVMRVFVRINKGDSFQLMSLTRTIKQILGNRSSLRKLNIRKYIMELLVEQWNDGIFQTTDS